MSYILRYVREVCAYEDYTFVVVQLLAARLHHLVIHRHPWVLLTELREHL